MKNMFLVLLCLALTGCVIWGCTASGQADGLAKENDALKRKYQVLQTLYAQARAEADSLLAAQNVQENTAAAAEAPLADAAPGITPAAADIWQFIMNLPVPEEKEEGTAADPEAPETGEETAIFTVPEPALSAEPETESAEMDQSAVLPQQTKTEDAQETEDAPEEIILDSDEEIPIG